MTVVKKDLVGISYGRWIVLREIESKRIIWRNREYVHRFFECRCECWEIRKISYTNLTTWISKSCWCLKKELARNAIRELHKSQKWSWNPNWRWWIAKKWDILRSKERNAKQYREWRSLVLLRDWWRCKRCEWVKRLEAHHIKNFKQDKNNFNIDNWICFCSNCHHQFHKKYWFSNNTQKQIDEFIFL